MDSRASSDRTPGAAPGPGARPTGAVARPTLRDAGPVGRGALVALLVATVVVATSLTGPWDPPLTGEEAPLPTATPGTPPPTLPPDPFTEALDQVDVQPWDLTWLGIALAVLVACGALYLLVRLVRMLPRRRPEDPPEDGGVEPGQTVGAAGGTPDLPALRDGVQGAGEHLAARVPPADAVIAAWVALEEAADRSGLHRDPAATPTEFTVEVLDRTPVDPAAIRTLLVLYLRARFSTDPLGPDDVATATEAVRTLAEGLTARDDGDDGPADPGAPDPPAAPGPPGGPT